MPCIEEMNFSILQIFFEQTCRLGGYDGTILSPNDQCRWLIFLEVCLPFLIIPEIRVCIVEKCRSITRVAGALGDRKIKRPGVGTKRFKIAGALGVMPLMVMRCQVFVQRLRVLLTRIVPKHLERSPEFFVPALWVCFAILNYEGRNSFGMRPCQARS